MAENNGKIYITISDERTGGGLTPGTPESQQAESKKDNALLTYARIHFYNFIKTQAMQSLEYSINNIGNFSGNYALQRDVGWFKNIAIKAGNVVSSGVSGFVVSGSPVGAIIGAVLSAGAIGINEYKSYVGEMVSFNKQQREIDNLRDISGLDSRKNNSRGTLE